MENINTTSNAWYEKTWLVVILCIIFFPVGLYALWKNSSISKGWKIGVTAIIALIFILNLGDKDKTTSTSTETQNEVETEQPNARETETVANVEQDEAGAEKEAITQN